MQHLLLQWPLCTAVMVSFVSQDSYFISQVFLYIFPLLPQTTLLFCEHDALVHVHSAVPFAVTMHLEFGGQLMRTQGVAGLSVFVKQFQENEKTQRKKKDKSINKKLFQKTRMKVEC